MNKFMRFMRWWVGKQDVDDTGILDEEGHYILGGVIWSNGNSWSYRGSYVSFDGAYVEVNHGGTARLGPGRGVTRIRVDSIVSVEVKPPSGGTDFLRRCFPGWIRFVTAGTARSVRLERLGRRTVGAGTDPGAMRTCSIERYRQLLALRDAVEAVREWPMAVPSQRSI